MRIGCITRIRQSFSYLYATVCIGAARPRAQDFPGGISVAGMPRVTLSFEM